MTNLEQLLAMKGPVMEAEYAIDERTALELYDCLRPRIKEHRRFKIQRDAAFSTADLKAQIRVNDQKLLLEEKRLPTLSK